MRHREIQALEKGVRYVKIMMLMRLNDYRFDHPSLQTGAKVRNLHKIWMGLGNEMDCSFLVHLVKITPESLS